MQEKTSTSLRNLFAAKKDNRTPRKVREKLLEKPTYRTVARCVHRLFQSLFYTNYLALSRFFSLVFNSSTSRRRNVLKCKFFLTMRNRNSAVFQLIEQFLSEFTNLHTDWWYFNAEIFQLLCLFDSVHQMLTARRWLRPKLARTIRRSRPKLPRYPVLRVFTS